MNDTRDDPAKGRAPEPILRAPDAFYHAALRTALVAALLFFLVCGLLVLNHARRQPYNPLEDARFVELKAELVASPLDEDLKARLRRLDLDLREKHFERLRFSAWGAHLLLGATLVLVISLKWVFAYLRPLPTPVLHLIDPEAPVPARWASLSIGAVGVLVAATVVGLALGHRDEVTREKLALLGSPEPDGTASSGPAPVEEPPRPPTAEELARNWPRFRGAGGGGVVTSGEAPSSFDAASGEGILWKTPVPLAGNSSPVVWEERVFLTGATESRQEVYCFDSRSGKLLWQEPVALGGAREPPELLESTGFAASTPATDSRTVCAIFATGDIAAFNHGGKRLWARKLGPLENMYGHATSLLFHGGLLLVPLDQAYEDEGKSRLLALDPTSGDTAWEVTRAVSASWATPIVASTEQGDRLITSASPWVIAYDPKTGSELWKADVMGGDVAPSPVYSGGLVLAVNIDAELVAIRPDGKGDVTETHVAWRGEDGLPDITSPVADGSRVYLVSTSGLITCYDLKSGELLWDEKLKQTFHSSPSLVGDRLHLWSTKGVLVVLQAGAEFQELGRSELGEEVNTSPAFAAGRIYLRTAKHLYCLGQR